MSSLLHRVSAGLMDSQTTFMSTLDQLVHEKTSMREKQTADYNQIVQQFNEYRKNNNLDEYFAKHLNQDTRKQTLELVQQVCSREDDWVDQMTDYFNSLQKYQYSDTSVKLQSLTDDMNAVKQRIAIYDEQNQMVE